MINLINKAKEENVDLEIKSTTQGHLYLRTLNDEVKEYNSSCLTGYNIKSKIFDKWVSLYTEDVSDYDKILENLKISATISDNNDEDSLAKENLINSDRDFDELDILKIKNDLLSLNEYRKQFPNILNIDCFLESNGKNILINNTLDVNLQDKTMFRCIYISVSASKDDKVSDASDYYLFKEYSKDELIEFFTKVLNTAISKLNEVSLKSDKYPVLINNNSMYDILNTFKDMFMAKTINKGVSILSNKFLDNIFSPLISIVEEPENEEFFGKTLFDSEGNRCLNKTIIDKGKFINKLYDNKEALKDGVKSTGNASGVNNMYLVPGDKSFDDLVMSIDDGVLITELSGLHSGVNTITGDMSLEAKGFKIENGSIKHAVTAIMLSANLFEVLNNVKAVGNDLKFGSTNVGSPSILCDNIMIVGEN